MNIEVRRTKSGQYCITGVLALDSGQSWASMELPLHWDDHDNVPGITCIPAGTYTVERMMSEHFQRMMPHVVGVPGRTDIEIHPASYPHDIKGCIAVGHIFNPEPKGPDDVVLTDSQESFYDEFEPLFNAAIGNREVVTIRIANEFRAMSA
jgi:hypothetical protein